MKILSIINDFLTKNRKNILYFLGFLLVFFAIFNTALAEGNTAVETEVKDKNMGLELLTVILKSGAAILGMLTYLVGLFLNPQWTSGGFFGLGGPLKTIWILVSNVVYFLFAMLFIWIAFMNIIGKEDGYQLKEALPRFIVGVLIVPFSWFFVQFVLSISSILTVAVLSLPYDTFKDKPFFNDAVLKKIEFCKDHIILTGSSGSLEPIRCGGSDKNAGADSGDGKGNKISLLEIVNGEKTDNLFGIMAFYTYGVMSVESIGKLFTKDLTISNVKDLVSLFGKGIFDALFFVVYLLLMAALALALFTRGVYLWFFAMFSPVFGLLYYFKKTDGAGDGVMKSFSVKAFIDLAFVPVYVSAALAFGLVFLFVAGKGFSTNENSDGKQIFDPDGKSIYLGDMKFTMEGGFMDGVAKEDALRFIEGFKGPFGTLILETFGIAILWIALMAALKTSSITANVVSPFEEFGSSIGKLVTKAPHYMPIIPGTGLSAHGLAQVGATPEQALRSKSSDVAGRYSNAVANFMGGKIVDQKILDKMDRLLNDNKIESHEVEELLKTHNDLVREFGRNNPAVRNMERKIAKVAGENKGLLTNEQLGGADKEGLKKLNEEDIAKLFAGGGKRVANSVDVKFYKESAGFPGNNFQSTGSTAPFSGTRNININAGTTTSGGVTTPTTKSIAVKIVGGKINEDTIKIKDLFIDGKGHYKQADFEDFLRDNISGLEPTEIKRIIDELKKDTSFFKP